jgi:dihydroorotase
MIKNKIIIKDTAIVNEGKIVYGDLLIVNDRIEKIGGSINENGKEINGYEKHVMPGIIDDQVHFREPGLTTKADIQSESKAAVAGGTTSFMEMPNTKPAATNIEELEWKYARAKETSWSNYSFFMGTTNDNFEEIAKVDFSRVCGLKIFMGSSTGNMLVDNAQVLENIFGNVDTLIATHCEDEATVIQRNAEFTASLGSKIDANYHPIIRNEEACYLSSSFAVELAKKMNTRLHILHISTSEELDLFTNNIPLSQKRITSEVCVHHLAFTADDYDKLGNKIKCNPAIKDKRHAPLLLEALLDDRLDIIATDHAPHTIEEKNLPYTQAPSGLPLVQHSLNMMLEFYHKGKISFEKIVEKMCHAPSTCFNIDHRGFLREGYFADVVMIDLNKQWKVAKENIYYKCGWSPLEGKEFTGNIEATIVNGNIVYQNGKHIELGKGMRMTFGPR